MKNYIHCRKDVFHGTENLIKLKDSFNNGLVWGEGVGARDFVDFGVTVFVLTVIMYLPYILLIHVYDSHVICINCDMFLTQYKLFTWTDNIFSIFYFYNFMSPLVETLIATFIQKKLKFFINISKVFSQYQ